jgi:DNA-binding CsgD family transcriptional regulator
MELGNFFERSNRAETLQDLFSVLVEASRDEGFDRLSVLSIDPTGPKRLRPVPRVVALKYAGSFFDHYRRQNYSPVDPVLKTSLLLARPFHWASIARQELEPAERQVLNDARDFGLRNCVSVPLHGAFGSTHYASYASPFEDEVTDATISRVNAISVLFHSFYRNLPGRSAAPRPFVRLSQREIECLKWIAQGKSSWDIGGILGISDNTVKFHVGNAMRKLRTTSRTVSVIRAVRLGLIDLPQ